MLTVIAVLCHLAAPCVDEIVTDSSLDPSLTMTGCMVLGVVNVAKWKSEHPIYRRDDWRVAKIKCEIGRRVPKSAA